MEATLTDLLEQEPTAELEQQAESLTKKTAKYRERVDQWR